MLPDGIGFASMTALEEGYGVSLYETIRHREIYDGVGPTPRAAMIAAIEAARERGDG